MKRKHLYRTLYWIPDLIFQGSSLNVSEIPHISLLCKDRGPQVAGSAEIVATELDPWMQAPVPRRHKTGAVQCTNIEGKAMLVKT
jgi:hypothetical protein